MGRDPRFHARDRDATFHVARQWYDKGVAHRRLKRYKDALVCFDRALALCDTDGDWWNWKGVTLSDLKRHDEALACFDRTLAIAPDDAYAADYRALSLYNLDRDEEALVAYDHALTLDPTADNCGTGRGERSSLDRDEEALACFDRAVELAPDKANDLNIGRAKRSVVSNATRKRWHVSSARSRSRQMTRMQQQRAQAPCFAFSAMKTLSPPMM